MRKLIKVEQKHIDTARADKFYTNASCPVALALKEQLPNLAPIFVVDMHTLDRKLKYKSPRSVKRFVKNFDNNKPVKPFNFYFQNSK